jgi:outer membrane receptor protein involved in Fe transport
MTFVMQSARPTARFSRNWLACGASTLALVLGSNAAQAQDAEDEVEDVITVTGSRIRTDGMQAPVPVTVVAAEEIEALSPGALITGVSQLPQFYGNQTPNSGNFFTRSGYGSLNMRGLGTNRTLTLLNGRRVPSTSAFGGVDINLFPEAMLRSVETTTGGASAAYGSDAVAGVVNFILDTNYEGLELNAQGGITDRNDGENYELSAAFGTDFGGGRGHILASGEYYKQEGIFSYEGRDWYQSWAPYGAGTVADPIKFAPGFVSTNSTFDGLISAPGTAIHGWRFSPDGSVAPGVSGSINQGGVGTPGARTAGTGIPGTAAYSDNNSEVASLYPDLERYSAFVYADYDLTDNLTVFGQYLHGKTSIFQFNSPRGGFGVPPTALTIFSGNPYLPANLQTLMTQNNIASFSLRRQGSFEDVGQMYIDDETTQHIGTAGFEYNVADDGVFGGWNVEGFYQYGHSRRNWRQLGLRVDRIFAAVDAVRDPNNPNNIVCRVSTTVGGAAAFPGCQPVNLFGRGGGTTPTPSGYDYVVGFEPGQSITAPVYYASDGFASGETRTYETEEEKVYNTVFSQHFAELAFAGDIMDLWAGTVAGAFGGSYRRDHISQLVNDVTNPSANNDSFFPVRCNNASIGLRGVNGGDCANTVGVQFSKVSNIRGTAEVWEAFGELLVPLYDSDDFTANASGAFRWADYSGSGTVWAYKGGLEFGLLQDQLRLRSTFSIDVRAGNLSERFDKTGGVANVDDPRIPGVESIGVTRFSGGNPAVRPEEAETFTAGMVFRPDWLSGFSFSLDYYNIRIQDAISQVGTQSVVNRCFQDQAQEFCDLITLDTGPATPTSTGGLILVGDVFVNVARAAVEGLDVETSYNTDITLFGGDETLGARALGSWLISRTDTNANGVTSNLAGQLGGALPYADFKATASVTYRNGPFNTMLQARYTDDGLQNACGQPGRCSFATYSTSVHADNRVPSVTYLDLRLGYDFEVAGTDMALSFNVSNLTDKAPPITPSWSTLSETSLQYNSAVYDVLGRRYTLGLRVKM